MYGTDTENNGEGGDEEKSKEKGKPTRGRGRKRSEINELLKKGEQILVQVAKDRMGTKGARITNHITLAGKYLVLMPTVNRIGVSRKITSAEERRRLRDMVNEMREPGLGFIIRTAADGVNKRAFKQDLDYLQGVWRDISSRADSKDRSVGLIYEELDLLGRILRDTLSNKYARVLIDDEETYVRAVDLVHRNQKSLAARVKLYTGDKPIFEEFNIEPALEEAISRKVMLKSGGSIVVHQTEALTSIDVNTGRFVGSKNLEDTALQTNLEAAKEIVHQLKLRELGGIIVIDFIDMEKKSNRKTLIDSLNEELEVDSAERTVLNINEFGMVVLTRKRVRGSLEKTLTRACPYCNGNGYIKTHETVACEVLRELERIGHEGVRGELRVMLNKEICEHLTTNMEKHLSWVREHYGLEVTLVADEKFHTEQFEIIEI
jgi:ribonuclease G